MTEELTAHFSLEQRNLVAQFNLQETSIPAVFKINASGTTWGSISGSLENQTDLKDALDDKASTSDLSALENEISDLSGVVDNNYSTITNRLEIDEETLSNLSGTISGYGDIVTHDADEFATVAQGLLADTALQPNDNISELNNDVGYITSSSLPTVNNGILTIQQNGVDVVTFGANSSENATANITVPTDTSDLTNGAGYITSSALTNYVTTNTAQTITANKTFHNAELITDNMITLNGSTAFLRGLKGIEYRNLIKLNSSGVTIGSTNEVLTLNGSGTRPKYNSGDLALYSDIPTDTADLTNGAGFLTNNATGTNALAVGNTSQSTAEGGVALGYSARANSTYATAIGEDTRATNTNTTVIGRAAKATQARAIAIGSGAEANAQDAIAIKGVNNTQNTFQVYTYNMLDMSTGLIPDARISTNLARTSDMQTADNNLQSQIDAIVVSSDVYDIVATYADLQAYDISTVPVNDIIKVLIDSTHNDAATYYRCVESGGVKSWSYIGSEGAYYTKSEADALFVDQTTTVNGQALSSNITLTASDVGALPDSTIIPTVNDATLTIEVNSTPVGTFTANASSNANINITVPTDTGDLTNNAGFITGITSGDVITALGYTPYNSSNPNGYTSNIGTVTSVNNTSPDGSGNVTLTSSNVGALSDSTKYGADLSYSSNSLQLLDQDGNSLGSSVIIQSSPDIDNKSITTNSDDELQTIGVIDQNNTNNAIKTWTGTKAEYDAIVTKDNNTVYWITDIKVIYLGTNAIGNFSGGRNIGEILTSSLPLTDAGLHLLDGSLIQGGGIYSAFVDYIADLYDSGNYPDLFDTEANWQSAVTTYGVCGKFVYDSNDSTVRLPKITGIVEGTTDATALGDLVQAGLPNITGDTGVCGRLGASDAYSANGAFTASTTTQTAAGYDTSKRAIKFDFDASRSSSIYGNSTTVQPQTIKVLVYIVIATTTKTDIQVDIDEIATDLNGKADVDLSNIAPSQSAKDLIRSYCTPDWDNAILVSFSSFTYTAPSDGWIFGTFIGAGTQAYAYVNGDIVSVGRSTSAWASDANVSILVSKGDIFTADNTVNFAWGLYFVPCKGVS